jgi:hypothetical protein
MMERLEAARLLVDVDAVTELRYQWNNGAQHLKAELAEKYGVDVNWSNIRPKVRIGKNYVSLPSERRRRIEQLYPKPSRLTAIAHQWLTSKVNAAVAEAEREMQTSHRFVRRSHISSS